MYAADCKAGHPLEPSQLATLFLSILSKTVDRELQSFVSHPVVRAAAALGHWSLVFDSCAMPAESSLRPSEMSIDQTSSAAGAWIFELRQRIGGTASPRPTSKGEIDVSKPRHLKDAIAASLPAQPGRYDCRSRRGRRSFGSIRWLLAHRRCLDSRSTPQCQVPRSRARCDPCRRAQVGK